MLTRHTHTHIHKTEPETKFLNFDSIYYLVGPYLLTIGSRYPKFIIFTYNKIYLTVLRFKFTQDLHLTIV